MDDAKDYRSRHSDPIRRQHQLDLLLHRLEDVERDTDPTEGKLADGKDHRAFSTLLHVRELVDAVAGWARDHVYGLSMAGLKMLPRQPHPTNSHPEYTESRRLSDAHEHELKGGDLIDVKPTSVTVRRLILRNLVFAGAGGFPDWLRQELLEALDALDAGAQMPLLEPTKRKGTAYTKAKAQLRLVTFVKFRSRAFAVSEDEARAVIGQMIGCESETLKGWERRLKDSCLGEVEVRSAISFAINAASSVRHAGKTGSAGTNVSDEDLKLSEFNREIYGEAALVDAVAAWRQAEKLQGSE